MSYSLLPYIFNSCWFISEGSVQGLLPIVKSIYKGEIPKIDAEEKLRHQMYQINAWSTPEDPIDNTDTEIPEETPAKKYIAVIPVFDVITLQDQFCGPKGTYTKSRFLEEAGQNPDVEGVILFIDSPGGEAHAMFQFTNAINEFKANYKKPIVAYVGSMAASAAYGIAASCDSIVVSDTHAVLGSIGTYITVLDKIKSLEADGIFIQEIYAADSTNKNAEWRAAIAGDEKPMLKMLKAYNDRFVSIVKDGKPDIKETDNIKPFTGSTIFGSDAISIGMADAIGNMNIAVDQCQKISKSNNSQTNNTMNIPFQKAWASIAAFFSDKKEGEPLTEAEVVKLNTELGNQKTTITDLTSQISEKDTEIANLTQQLAEAKTGSDALQSALTETEVKLTAANAELAKRPGTSATTPEAEVEKIEIDQDVNLDEINQVAKQYR
jgi:protease-4